VRQKSRRLAALEEALHGAVEGHLEAVEDLEAEHHEDAAALAHVEVHLEAVVAEAFQLAGVHREEAVLASEVDLVAVEASFLDSLTPSIWKALRNTYKVLQVLG